MIRVKICGITNPEDAMFAAELGADAVGFIFHRESPRVVEPKIVREITEILPPYLTRVGVFVNEKPETIKDIIKLCRLDVAQLHGSEPPAVIGELGVNTIKSLRLKEEADVERISEYDADAFLLDTYVAGKFGGTGKTFNWRWALTAKKFNRPIVLSGGLTPENVAEAIDAARPDGVDVSSGVEASPGKKDKEKLARFIETVRLK